MVVFATHFLSVQLTCLYFISICFMTIRYMNITVPRQQTEIDRDQQSNLLQDIEASRLSLTQAKELGEENGLGQSTGWVLFHANMARAQLMHSSSSVLWHPNGLSDGFMRLWEIMHIHDDEDGDRVVRGFRDSMERRLDDHEFPESLVRAQLIAAAD
jgi:hypothetical protein